VWLAELCERTRLPRATAYRWRRRWKCTACWPDDEAAGDSVPQSPNSRRASTIRCWPPAAPVLPQCARAPAESVQRVPPRGDVAGLCGAWNVCGFVTGAARRRPTAMTAGFGPKCYCAQRRRHPASRAAHAKFTDGRWPKSAARLGAEASEREPGWASVVGPVCATVAGVGRSPPISVSGPIDRIGRRPGARWAADLLSAAEAMTRRL